MAIAVLRQAGGRAAGARRRGRGGFDVYAGLPLALTLAAQGRNVHVGNLSIVNLYDLDRAVWVEPGVVRPLRTAYRRLAKRLDLDAIVLVDGGTDILMRGDEAALGTPVEDATSLSAVHGTPVATRLVASIGFGVDAYHGVNHVQVLENIAALDRAGGYLGAFSVASQSREAALYRDAVAHAAASTPGRASLVNGQIAAALAGDSGDVPLDRPSRTTPLFVNPLMAMYFTFDLAALVAQSLYLDRIRATDDLLDVSHIIDRYRDDITPRPRSPFPH